MQTGARESLNLRKDGSVFPVRLVSDLVTDAESNPLAVVTVCEDITERKETEARLKASIAEKDVLLKEVHHRVKNNLQIISSLLNLQMMKITDVKTRAELNATRNRIRSMALIHAKLYQSKNLSQINFAEYIEEFSRQLRSLYNVSSKKVKLVLDIDAVYLDVDVAIPCGMIVNELLTNALKYAFPEERSGEIRVVLRSEQSETVLSVEDNGVGLPPGIDLERVETLGLQLVRGLAQQVNGTVTVEQSRGTRVVIRCPVAGSGMQRSV
jgi:two-component sensor histidine kinase